MKAQITFLKLLLILPAIARVDPVLADTNGPFTLNYANLVTGSGALAFSFPKFDPSLGALQSVDIAFVFSGNVVGTATGVGQSSSINSTITHSIFFDFTDLSDSVFIAEPALSLANGVFGGPQNSTISYGPEFQSTSLAFSMAAGDPRFDAWVNGPGDVSGSLSVYFTNTGFSVYGPQYFSGSDSGVYNGSLAVAYNYAPVPEPADLAVVGTGLLLSIRSKHSGRKAA